jgi:hypothetical protein
MYYSMDAIKSNYEKETKAVNLKRRRLKLAQLLRAEREALEVQMRLTSIGISDCMFTCLGGITRS